MKILRVGSANEIEMCNIFKTSLNVDNVQECVAECA